MKVLIMTNEYPPYTYGGAGVHVEYLSKELAKLMPVEVRSFGDQYVAHHNLLVRGFKVDTSGYGGPKALTSVFGSAQRGLDFNSFGIDADLVHCHTWYTHLGGIVAKLTYGVPLVITTHSLEPLRPWKREQLGGGYDFSKWVERTALEMADAIIAVSHETKRDIRRHFRVAEDKITVIHNGIDPAEYRKLSTTEALVRYGVDPNVPYVLFVGRVTRQKASPLTSCSAAPPCPSRWRSTRPGRSLERCVPVGPSWQARGPFARPLTSRRGRTTGPRWSCYGH